MSPGYRVFIIFSYLYVYSISQVKIGTIKRKNYNIDEYCYCHKILLIQQKNVYILTVVIFGLESVCRQKMRKDILCRENSVCRNMRTRKCVMHLENTHA